VNLISIARKHFVKNIVIEIAEEYLDDIFMGSA